MVDLLGDHPCPASQLTDQVRTQESTASTSRLLKGQSDLPHIVLERSDVTVPGTSKSLIFLGHGVPKDCLHKLPVASADCLPLKSVKLYCRSPAQIAQKRSGQRRGCCHSVLRLTQGPWRPTAPCHHSRSRNHSGLRYQCRDDTGSALQKRCGVWCPTKLVTLLDLQGTLTTPFPAFFTRASSAALWLRSHSLERPSENGSLRFS